MTIGAFAANTVANITSSGTFTLRGVPVKTEGIPSWPMVVGDELSTDSSAASIRFVDGSLVTLARNSKAQVTKTDGKLTLRLVSGSMDFKLANGSGLRLLNNATPVLGQSGIVTTSPGRGSQRPILSRVPPPPPPGPISTR